MAEPIERRNSNTELLQELEALSQSLYQSHTSRRTASLILPRSAVPNPNDVSHVGVPVEHHHHGEDVTAEHRPRSRRMSMSPWRSRPPKQQSSDHRSRHHSAKSQATEAVVEEKKGIWSWKPMRALSHITMHRMGCLFSVEVITIQGLPASMNGLRLSVAVRKKETKDSAVQTLPARVLQGGADFEETMFIRCHVYCIGGAGSGKPVKFEPRPFLISTVAIDAPELDFGKSTVDLSLLLKESMEKNSEGVRIRQWDKSIKLSGKAKGGELVVKLGFQIMEDGGVGIYSSPAEGTKSTPPSNSAALARKQSKTSFSVSSPRTPSRPEPAMTPSKDPVPMHIKDIDDFHLDEPPPVQSSSPPAPKPEPEAKGEEVEVIGLPEFDVVDKGVEIQVDEKHEDEEPATGEDGADAKSVSSEVILKEVVLDPAHQKRLTELDSIAQQIMALESMMTGDGGNDDLKLVSETGSNGLDAEEETVTREFLQMLELEDDKEFKFDVADFAVHTPKPGAEGGAEEGEAKVFVSDLGKGLGSVVQTKDGGYLAAANPFDTEVPRKETPKLAIQISKPLILRDQNSASGFEVFQRMAAMGPEELGSELLSLMAMDELIGKTAEQIAFEGIASAIISRRSREGASSSAARSVAAIKTMATALAAGRKERIRTGIWNASEEPVAVEDILAFALQKIESMAVEALKIQADMAEEEAPFDVFTLISKDDPNPPLSSAITLDDWAKNNATSSNVTMLVVVQLRDPLRRYETVGAPVIGLVQAARVDDARKDEEESYKVASLHVSGLRLRPGAKRSGWDGENQRLTAMQWLVAYGLGKAGTKKAKNAQAVKAGQDLIWSLSSRVMADMWLKPMRNPDVKFPKQQ